MRKRLLLSILIFLCFFISACACESIKVRQTGASAANSSNNLLNKAPYGIVRHTYSKKNITINYPQIIKLGDNRRQKKINRIIKEESLKIIDLYKDSIEGNDINIDVNYTVGLMNPHMLSIQYSGYSNIKNTAHPNNLFYTTNVNINTGNKIRLKDIVNINESFVKRFRNGEYRDWESGPNAERRAAVMEYLRSISDKDLIRYFYEADDLGLKNPSNTFSYLTKDSLGISMGVPHVLGEHAELEIKNDNR